MTHDGMKEMLMEFIGYERTKSGRYRIYGGLTDDTIIVSGRTPDEAYEKLARIEFVNYINKLWWNRSAFHDVICITNPPSISFVLPDHARIPYKKPSLLLVGDEAREYCINQGLPYTYRSPGV